MILSTPALQKANGGGVALKETLLALAEICQNLPGSAVDAAHHGHPKQDITDHQSVGHQLVYGEKTDVSCSKGVQFKDLPNTANKGGQKDDHADMFLDPVIKWPELLGQLHREGIITCLLCWAEINV